jgi:hypothetical protein
MSDHTTLSWSAKPPILWFPSCSCAPSRNLREWSPRVPSPLSPLSPSFPLHPSPPPQPLPASPPKPPPQPLPPPPPPRLGWWHWVLPPPLTVEVPLSVQSQPLVVLKQSAPWHHTVMVLRVTVTPVPDAPPLWSVAPNPNDTRAPIAIDPTPLPPPLPHAPRPLAPSSLLRCLSVCNNYAMVVCCPSK